MLLQQKCSQIHLIIFYEQLRYEVVDTQRVTEHRVGLQSSHIQQVQVATLFPGPLPPRLHAWNNRSIKMGTLCWKVVNRAYFILFC